MYEKTEGYCINFDHDGMHVLEPCTAEYVSDQYLFLPYYDVENDIHGYRGLERGVDFFYKREEGLVKLIELLEWEREEHLAQAIQLKELAQQARVALEEEKANGKG